MNATHFEAWTGGTWTQKPTFPITKVTQDSRQACLGVLYVALKGEHHDGHDFVSSAFRAGATAAMVKRGWMPPADVAGLPLLCVDDPAQALSDLAEGYRKSLKATVVGITGSAGKTTLKELTAAMLSGAGQTAATPGNYNNEVGLPLSLLSVPEEARFAVIEAGISHPNDMDPLAKTMCPDVAAISCIGPAHIEYFGSERAIAAEKAKLLAKVPATGFAVIPDTCAEFETLRAACQCRIITCSIKNETADWYGEPLAKGVVRVHHGDESAVLLETGLAGEHNASNALVAYALARECGISAAEALAGLRNFKAPAMRWETTRAGSFTIINDAYNANPLSMRAALETFAGSDVTGTKVVCIGDMLELGDASDRQHREVGEASGNGPWRLLAGVGTASRALIEGAIKAGYPASQTVWFATTSEAVEALPLLLQPGDTLLLKASRGMKLEQISDALRA